MSYKMNFKLIVLNGYTEYRNEKTPYRSYFKREAKNNNRDYNVEFSDYFKGCQNAIKSYKDEIINQYNNRVTEKKWVVLSIKSGNGLKFGDEIVTDQSDKRLQDKLKSITEEQEFIQRRYVYNYDYVCYLNETGGITNDIFEKSNDRKLYWQDIIQIEQGVLEAKEAIETELCIITEIEEEIEINSKKSDSSNKTKHNFSYRISPKYDSQKIYDTFFTGEILQCTNDKFNDWFVDGFETTPIKPILKGKISPKTGKESIAYGQIRKFIETIMETDKIKDTYFVKVFGLPKDSETGKNLDINIKEKLESCKKQVETKK